MGKINLSNKIRIRISIKTKKKLNNQILMKKFSLSLAQNLTEYKKESIFLNFYYKTSYISSILSIKKQ